MEGLRLTGIRKCFGSVSALRRVDFEVPEGQLAVLLGRSGCGKTTTLRLIAGLESPDEGEILLHGQDLRPLPPHERGVAMVFQMPALYPHMTVQRNLGFGMRLQRKGAREIDQRVRHAAELLGIGQLMHRRPHELSGGEQHRVALGKAIVAQPRLWLLDEPLAALDAPLRRQLGREIVSLQKRTGTTALFVTHDQAEALALADWLIVMHEGRVQQVGAPDDVYAHPATGIVASFLGDPPMNLLRGKIAQGRFHSGPVCLGAPPELPEGPVVLGVRPEHVRLAAAEDPDAVPAIAAHLQFRGHDQIVEAAVGEQKLLIRSPSDGSVRKGDRIAVVLPPERCAYFEATAEGRRLV